MARPPTPLSYTALLASPFSLKVPPSNPTQTPSSSLQKEARGDEEDEAPFFSIPWGGGGQQRIGKGGGVKKPFRPPLFLSLPLSSNRATFSPPPLRKKPFLLRVLNSEERGGGIGVSLLRSSFLPKDSRGGKGTAHSGGREWLRAGINGSEALGKEDPSFVKEGKVSSSLFCG